MDTDVSYRTAQEAQLNISRFFLRWYNLIRPQYFNGRLSPGRAEEKLNAVSGFS
jgi:putative transposase